MILWFTLYRIHPKFKDFEPKHKTLQFLQHLLVKIAQLWLKQNILADRKSIRIRFFKMTKLFKNFESLRVKRLYKQKQKKDKDNLRIVKQLQVKRMCEGRQRCKIKPTSSQFRVSTAFRCVYIRDVQIAKRLGLKTICSRLDTTEPFKRLRIWHNVL